MKKPEREWWQCPACGDHAEVIDGSPYHSCEPYDWACRTNELLQELLDARLRDTVRQVVAEVMEEKRPPRTKLGVV